MKEKKTNLGKEKNEKEAPKQKKLIRKKNSNEKIPEEKKLIKNEKIKEQKKLIRKKFIEIRKQIPAKERKIKSLEITKKIFCLPEFINSKKIMVYHSFKEEVETQELIEKSIEFDKEVFIPGIEDEKKCLMQCIKLEKGIKTEMEKDCFGICIPKNKNSVLNPEKLDLVIVPGIAFDLKGNRLGWGKGYFDRFLKKTNEKCIFIGLGFEEQISEKELPSDEMDVKIHLLITEEKIRGFRKQ
ncbi:MAG: 5-formyltetrahydrofolate cyclo-ligase [Candidatus Diapherotrites archaeon]